MAEVEILAVCDTQLEKAQAVCEKHNFGNAYTDVAEMFKKEQPDFVDIITPPNTHLALCELAAVQGIHIICQKPLVPTLAEAKELARLISNSSVRMMVHENFRFQPWHREIKKLLQRHSIGEELYTINLRMRMGDGWQEDAYMDRQPYFREMERLLIYETGIHFIDVFRYFGGEIANVRARLRTLNKNIKGEDFAWVNFEFANGMLGFLDANRYNESTAVNPRLTFGQWQVDGSNGSLRLYEDGKLTIQNLGEREQQHHYEFKDVNFAGDCVYATQEHFITCLQHGEQFETSVADYLENMKCLEAIYASNDAR